MTEIKIEYSEEEKKNAQEQTQKYRKFINDNPELMSMLYDVDLLPEQIVLWVNALRMTVICELFKMTLNDKENKTPDEQT